MINPPPLLLGVGTVFWGYYCDQLVMSLVVAGMLEGVSVLKFRLELAAADFRRILILSILILATVTAYFFVTHPVRGAVLQLLQWFPLMVLPMIVAQQYSSSEALNWRSLLPLLASSTANSHKKPLMVDLGFPYLALCLIAASAANMRTFWFYIACALICAWGLWIVRPRRHSPFMWGGVFVLATGLGLSVHVSLNHLQHYLIDATMDLLVGEGVHTDPYSNTTQLGHLGTLKLSDRILMRIFPESRFTPPLLLRRASYDRYLYGKWIAKDAKLRPMTPDAGSMNWTFNRDIKANNKILISEYLDRGVAVLALPFGTVQLRHLSVAELKRNRLGTVQIKDEEKPVSYEVLYDTALSRDADPTGYDLKIPEHELETLSQIIGDLGAIALSETQIVDKVKTFFAENFAYSLSQENPTGVEDALKEFLTKTRYGHCEYFATATVLLLRVAGIPARYETGFSVQEYSDLEEAYVVRLRHAHAWARAYVDGAWIDLDTTPTVWADVEQANAPLWQPLLDVGSWLWFKYTDWQIRDSDALLKSLSIALILMAIGCLAWWLRRKRHKPTREKVKTLSSPPKRWPGSDSEFCLIEQKLMHTRLERKRGEPLVSWVRRISGSESIPVEGPSLIDIASLHYRYRFSSEGIDQTQRRTLNDGVHYWLEYFENRLEHQKVDKSYID